MNQPGKGGGWDLQSYRDQGYLVLSGLLGDEPVIVVVPPYAQQRIKQRDIDESEVLEVLAKPRSSHGADKNPGRREVTGTTARGNITAVYERPAQAVVIVITVYPE